MASVSALSTTGTTTGSTTSLPNKLNSMDSSDFINLMITQLKNQDPTKPMTNQELLAQVTQIGTLQSQNQLQTSLQDMTLQNQITSAAGMIGKKVTGLADDSSEVNGVVTSIKVVDKAVTLELDDGSTLPLGNVTQVEPDSASATPTTNSTVSASSLATGAMAGSLKTLLGA